MAEEIGLVPSKRLKIELNSHLCRVKDLGPKTRDLSGFIDERFFTLHGSDFRRSIYGDGQDRDAWESGDGLEEEDDDEVVDDDVVDEGDVEVEGLIGVNDNNKVNCSNNTSIVEDKMGKGITRIILLLRMIVRDSGIVQQTISSNPKGSPSKIHHHHGRIRNYHNAVIVVEAEGKNDMGGDNGCGFNGRKDVSYSNEPEESLKAILCDSITSTLMDDAMILPCGYSFGGGGIYHVIRMNSLPSTKKFIIRLIYIYTCVYGRINSVGKTKGIPTDCPTNWYSLVGQGNGAPASIHGSWHRTVGHYAFGIAYRTLSHTIFEFSHGYSVYTTRTLTLKLCFGSWLMPNFISRNFHLICCTFLFKFSACPISDKPIPYILSDESVPFRRMMSESFIIYSTFMSLYSFKQ
ncbi:hypothetical protein UlMin_010643 [Ulmus minor]